MGSVEGGGGDTRVRSGNERRYFGNAFRSRHGYLERVILSPICKHREISTGG